MDLVFINYMVLVRFIILLVGTLGNLFSFVIFLRPAFKNNSISTYGQALGLFNCYILFRMAAEIDQYFYNTHLPSRSELHCKLLYYALIPLVSVPGWIQVVFSIDKVLSITRSNVSTILNKKWFQWLIIAAIVLFHFLLYLELPILITLGPFLNYQSYCTPTTLPFYKIFAIMNLLDSGIIPFGFMLVTSAITVYLMRKSRLSVERGGHLSLSKSRKSREIRFALSSLVFNVLFILCRLPTIISFILNGYNIYLGEYFDQISYLLYYGNPAATLLIHMGSNSLFRREMMIFLNFKKFNQISAYFGSNSSNRFTH